MNLLDTDLIVAFHYGVLVFETIRFGTTSKSIVRLCSALEKCLQSNETENYLIFTKSKVQNRSNEKVKNTTSESYNINIDELLADIKRRNSYCTDIFFTFG